MSRRMKDRKRSSVRLIFWFVLCSHSETSDLDLEVDRAENGARLARAFRDDSMKRHGAADGCDPSRTPNTLVPMMSEHSVFQTVLLPLVKVDSPPRTFLVLHRAPRGLNVKSRAIEGRNRLKSTILQIYSTLFVDPKSNPSSADAARGIEKHSCLARSTVKRPRMYRGKTRREKKRRDRYKRNERKWEKKKEKWKVVLPDSAAPRSSSSFRNTVLGAPFSAVSL